MTTYQVTLLIDADDLLGPLGWVFTAIDESRDNPHVYGVAISPYTDEDE